MDFASLGETRLRESRNVGGINHQPQVPRNFVGIDSTRGYRLRLS
jgi:hypothetical protein